MEWQENSWHVVGEVLDVKAQTLGSGARMCKVKISNTYGEKRDGSPLRTVKMLTAWRDMADICENLNPGDIVEFFCRIYNSKSGDTWYENADVLNVGQIKKDAAEQAKQATNDDDIPW